MQDHQDSIYWLESPNKNKDIAVRITYQNRRYTLIDLDGSSFTTQPISVTTILKADGTPGESGRDGQNGVNGQRGAPGIDAYFDGFSEHCGTPGGRGQDGTDATPGTSGQNGGNGGAISIYCATEDKSLLDALIPSVMGGRGGKPGKHGLTVYLLLFIIQFFNDHIGIMHQKP